VTVEPTDPNCEFCSIAQSKDRFAEVVCENTNWIAFFPLNPATPGHTLVIPRRHVADLWQLDLPLGSELMTAVIGVGRAIEQAMRPEGMNLITSAGETAEQTVFHLHLHIVPRWRRDGFGHIWPVEGKFDDASLEGFADRIREAWNATQATDV
jgi:histidine triad (HIT) family protein